MPHVTSISSHMPYFKDLYLLPVHLSLLDAENSLVASLLFSLRKKISHAIEYKMPFIVRGSIVLCTLRKK